MIVNTLESLLEETKGYDFPLFASRDKKIELLMRKKEEVDSKIKEAVADAGIRADALCSENVWNDALNESKEQFEGMNEKRMLNGFFFQEVMHRYVEKNINIAKEGMQ